MSTVTQASPPQTERFRSGEGVAANGDSARELAAELARLRERFVAYERLDHQLDEMVTGLTDLLRGATELRRRTNQDIAGAIARCETLIASDRAHHREVLTALLADLASTERRTAAITDAIAGLQTQLAGITQRLPATAPSRLLTPDSQPPTPVAPKVLATLTLVIRDVPSVTTALTLQRLVAGLDAVSAIQTREFAAGELHLRLALGKPFVAAELGLLPNGTFGVVDEENDRLVLRYVPPAAT
jgi:hypothetical protein